MKACENKECVNYGKRWSGYNFCKLCGLELREVLPGGDKEDTSDAGFCSYCGTKKDLEFAPKLGNGGEEIENVNPEQEEEVING